MGFRADVERWIAAADLCVLPSMREGLPRVVVQYVAAGKPVVVTHLEGIEEIVENGVNGFVVGRDDFEAMTCAVARLLDDPELACAMSQAARAQDLSCWSVRADGTGDRPDPAGHPAAKGGDASHRAKPSGDPWRGKGPRRIVRATAQLALH